MRLVRVISLQLLITAALLLVCEGVARVGYTVHLNLQDTGDWFVYTSDLGWDRRPNFNDEDDCQIDRVFDGRGLVASEAARLQPKREGQFRAMFLGESSTYGACVETENTFVGVANRLLPQTASFNLGVNGYSSYQGYKALLKYGKLIDPNIIFIAFNFNDRRFVLREEQKDSEAVFSRLYFSNRVRHLMEVSYLFRAASLVSDRIGSFSREAPKMLGDGAATAVRLDTVRPRVDPAAYRENLVKMVQWAKQQGIAVSFILFGDNPDQTYLLREGIKALEEGNHALAIQQLTLAKDNYDDRWFSALARLHLAKAYAAAGQAEQANAAFSIADAFFGITGGYPVHLDTDYHRIMREVAAEHGVGIVDAASELNKNSEVFFDFSHFDKRGHEIVGKLVAQAIEAAKINLASKKPEVGGL